MTVNEVRRRRQRALDCCNLCLADDAFSLHEMFSTELWLPEDRMESSSQTPLCGFIYRTNRKKYN